MAHMQQITVEQQGKKWFARCSFEQKDIVKAAGFRWDPDSRRWWTADPAAAAKFADAGAAQATIEGFHKRQEQRAESVELSRAAAPIAEIDIPSNSGLEYLPYQRVGIAYGMTHEATLYGDEMGLGKTIQFIGLVNADPTIKKVMIACPATLKLNWRNELRKWLTRKMTIGITEEHLKNAMEDGRKVVVFGHHHDVIEALRDEFGHKAVAVYGPMAIVNRQTAVERFQRDPDCQLFIGGILAAGVGLTLTAASHVVFAELDWVPGNVTQAEDRCHRIGQHDCVLVEHLVLEGSLDARMAEILVEKQHIIEQALDAEIPPLIVPGAGKERVATETLTMAAIAKEAIYMSSARIGAIMEGLRIVSGMDGDRARQRNGIGFSGADTFIGNRLAQLSSLTPKQAVLGAKLVNKYRRQIPEAIVDQAAV